MAERSARNTAMDLLARREHSRHQLQEKLRQRGFEGEEIDIALNRLVSEKLLDDERFAESYINQRIQKGYGPLRIRHELGEKGVDGEIINRRMESVDREWADLMREQRLRRFGADIPEDYRERMKQARFLQNRGFSPESVMRLFRR